VIARGRGVADVCAEASVKTIELPLILASERLPARLCDVLAYHEGEEWTIAFVDDGKWYSTDDDCKTLEHVTHWLPLPDRPA
jgi:hypothetical protein